MASKTFAFVSLGCPKNLVDSERMLGQLAQDGYALTPDADGADVVVVNTCGFIEPARQESLGVIREMLALKEQGRVGAVVVAGCLAERKKDDLLLEVPGVDHIVGVFGREEIVQVVNRSLASPERKRGENGHEQRSLFRPAPVRALDDTARLRITPRHYAYLKISEGCDRLCTFCAIPGMRGKHVTKPIEEVIGEAKELIADGVRELILVAQDTTYYGLDLYGRVRLAELLRELDALEGLEWLRILYAYPMYFDDELIETIAGADKIVPYLDMPLQHINDRCLKRMQRRVTRAATEELLGKLRAASRTWRCARRSSSASRAKPRRSSRSWWRSSRPRASSAPASFPTRSSRGRRRRGWKATCPKRSSRNGATGSWKRSRKSPSSGAASRSAASWTC